MAERAMDSETQPADDRARPAAERFQSAMVHFRDMPGLDGRGERADVLEARPVYCPTPKRVSVSKVVMDWTQLEGTFVVTLDELELARAFRFSLSPYGIPRSSVPWLHFKSGRKSHVRAYSMPQELRLAIDRALQLVIPTVGGVPWAPLNGDQPVYRSVTEADMNPDDVAVAKGRFTTQDILATVEIPQEDPLSDKEEQI